MDRTRRQIDDLLNGDIDVDHESDMAEVVGAIRALTRATRTLASSVDDLSHRYDTLTTRIAQVGGGVVVSVLSAAILLALRSG